MINNKKKFDFNLKKDIPNFEERIKNGERFILKEIMKIPNLSSNERFYLSIYYNLDKDIKRTDNDFEGILSKNTIIKIRKRLIKLGYINSKEKKSIEQLKKLTIKNSHKGYKCEWCGEECYILHKHHYPIPANKGGIETVNICPNCHYTYHRLLGEYNYE